jgi:anti-sigma regulatory factor (Ser/Thr protein kinase)
MDGRACQTRPHTRGAESGHLTSEGDVGFHPPLSASSLLSYSGSLVLSPWASSVSHARSHVSAIAREWELEHLAGDIELIVSELVTNAYEATMKLPEPQVLVLRTFVNASALHVEVWDASPEMPKLQDPTEDLPGGRGLVIVEALSTCWGAHYGPRGGKCVWVQFARLVRQYETQGG